VRRTLALALVAATLFVGGCGSTGSATSGTTTLTASEWGLRYLLLDHYPNFAYCDPDIYPVAREDQQPAADAWWASADHGSAEVQAIIAEHAFREPLTSAQRLTAYGDHKKLTVISMTPVSGGYEYELSTSASGGEPNQTVVGVIGLDGSIHEISRRTRPGGCPICLEAGTRIATPGGDVLVALIRPGDLVWTTDATGQRVSAPVEQVASRPTPGPHLMLRLVLSDGRELVAAGAHPAADGTLLRQLHVADRYDGATVAAMQWVQSLAPTTFDLLPAGSTGTYWANGILVGSTLKH
jgi:hypothetical protein